MSVEKKTMTELCHGTGTIDGRPCPGCDECNAVADAMEEAHRGIDDCLECGGTLPEKLLNAGVRVCEPCQDDMADSGPCWCGVENPHYEPLPDRCGGDGVIHCECGGEFCVCHWHGEVECLGCPDCEYRDDDDDFEDEHEWNEDFQNWECEP